MCAGLTRTGVVGLGRSGMEKRVPDGDLHGREHEPSGQAFGQEQGFCMVTLKSGDLLAYL